MAVSVTIPPPFPRPGPGRKRTVGGLADHATAESTRFDKLYQMSPSSVRLVPRQGRISCAKDDAEEIPFHTNQPRFAIRASRFYMVPCLFQDKKSMPLLWLSTFCFVVRAFREPVDGTAQGVSLRRLILDRERDPVRNKHPIMLDAPAALEIRAKRGSEVEAISIGSPDVLTGVRPTAHRAVGIRAGVPSGRQSGRVVRNELARLVVHPRLNLLQVASYL